MMYQTQYKSRKLTPMKRAEIIIIFMALQQEKFISQNTYLRVKCDMKEVIGRVFTQDSSKPTTI